MMLIEAAVHAPLGMVDPEDPETIHAATMEALITAWPDKEGEDGKPLVSACGVVGKLPGTGDKVLLWPIRHAGPLTRCRACWEATGKQRPRKAKALA